MGCELIVSLADACAGRESGCDQQQEGLFEHMISFGILTAGACCNRRLCDFNVYLFYGHLNQVGVVVWIVVVAPDGTRRLEKG